MFAAVRFFLSRFGPFLIAMVGPLLSKILTALGIALVTVKGVGALQSRIISLVASMYSNVDPQIMQLIALSKIDVFMTLSISGLIAGWLFKNASRIMFK